MRITVTPYSIRDHLRKLLKTEFAVSVFVCFHDGFVHDLLQLRVLQPKIVSPDTIMGLLYGTNLEVAPNHHLQHQEQLSVRDVAVSVHIVDLERDWVRPSVSSGLSTLFSRGGLTSQLLFSPSSAAERAQTANEFLKVYRSSTTIRSIGVSRRRERSVVTPWMTIEAQGGEKENADVLFIKDCNHP